MCKPHNLSGSAKIPRSLMQLTPAKADATLSLKATDWANPALAYILFGEVARGG